MNRSKKKSFDWYGARQRFSIRKYHIGAASVLLGTTLVLGTGTIVGAETGVNGDGASNGQIVPGNGTGTSDGTQPQGDNQGDNSSGVQTGNTTNSTANDQSANDTGSASSQPVVNPRTMSLKPEGDGSTNPPVDESVIKFPTQDNQTPPAGYQSVLFHSSYVKLDFEGKPGEIEITRNRKPIQVVAFWVKTGTTWGALKRDPQFRMPKYTVANGDFILGYDRSVGQVIRPTDFDSLDDTPIVDTWEFSPTVDYIVGDVSDGKTFEEYMNSGSYAPYQILQFHGITLNANGGTVDGKAKKAFYVAYKHVQWGDELVTKKIVVPSRDGYTFVRWQTATGEGIPTSGQIETIEFTAVWLKHPTEAVKVFNPEQLSETDKTKVADLIRLVNPDLQNSIQEITVADNGDATVRFTTGEERTISGASLVSDNSAEQRAKAEEAISDAVLQKQDDIAKSQLTAKEQQDKLDKLRELQESIEEQIDGATSEDALDKIVEDGKNSIENFDLTSATKKTAAKQDLETAYNAKKDEIAKSALTAEEKTAKQAELDQAKSTADSAIDAATDNAGVDTALTNGQSAISGIDTSTSAKKAQAKEDLETAYNAKKDEIAKSALTAEEKAVKQAELDKAKEDAENAIVTATDNAGVDTALTNGQSAISGIDTSTSAKKDQAKEDLEAAYNAKKAEIENSALTDEEKAAKQAELDQAKSTADSAIDAATDDAGVVQALTDGKSAIAGIDTSTSAKKDQAKEELKAAADDAKKAIDANDNLTDAEKQAAKDAVDAEVAKANDAIDAATKADEVDAATLAGEKAVAKEELKAAADDAKKAIEANDNLTDAEKQAAKKAVDDEVAKANDAIDAATKADEVEAATLAGEKAVAKEDLEIAYNAKKNEIANSSLTAEEKAAKQAELDKAKADADKAIDAATDNAGVAKALEDGKSAIDAINTTTSAEKAAAKQALDEAYNAKKAEIENSALTAEEKAAKQAELDKAKEAADKAIDTATDNASVAKALEDGKATIDAINTTTSAEKAAAKKDLEAAYNAKKVEIENSALTAEEKAAKQAELDKAKADADKAIDAATDNTGVAKALEAGKAAIDAINTSTSAGIDTSTSAEKAAAKKDLEAAYNAKKAEIENSALTDEEKAAKQAELDKAKEAADKAIDVATDASGVAKALEAGKAAIDAINTTTSAEKAAAKKDLEDAYNAKKAEIENSALTAEEKAAKQAELDKAKADADKAIDAATDASGVAKALEDGKSAIDAINTSTSAGIDTSSSAKKAHKENKVLPKTGDNVGLSSVLGIAGLALLGTAIRKKRED
ncbi:DUF1542 domain-containing protein [Streptococcus suis]|nr:DUF1542 domain-containing protein [Streptococcus suis]